MSCCGFKQNGGGYYLQYGGADEESAPSSTGSKMLNVSLWITLAIVFVTNILSYFLFKDAFGQEQMLAGILLFLNGSLFIYMLVITIANQMGKQLF